MSTPAEPGRSGRGHPPRLLPRTLTGLLALLTLLATLAPLLRGDVAPAPVAFAHAASQGDDPLVRLAIARLTAVVGPGAVPDGVTPPERVLVRVLVEHRGDQPLEDVEVVLETFRRLVTRSALHQALDQGVVGNPRVVERLPVRTGTVQPGDIAAVDHFIDVSRLVQSGRTGVYPIKVTLRRGTTVLDSVVTAVIHLGERPLNPLETVVVWPLDAPPSTLPGGDDTDLDAAILPGGRIDSLVAGLEATPSSGIVPAVSASLLDALTRRADLALADDETATGPSPAALADAEVADAALLLLQRIRAVLASLTHPPVAGAFADADLTALLQASPALARLAGELAAEGPLRVEGLGGREPDAATHLGIAPLGPAALDLLPGDHVLLPWTAVPGPDLDGDPDLPFPVRRLRSSSGRLLTATIADPWLTAAVTAPDLRHGDAVAIQRVIAETAMYQFISPGVEERPLLLLPPRDWDPGGRVARGLAPALVNAPWLDLSPGSSHAAQAAGSLQETRLLPGEHLPATLIAELGATRDALGAITASLPEGTIRVAGRRVEELDDQLRRSSSHWFAQDPATAEAMIADVRASVETAYGVVEVLTADAVTLVSAQGKIPITIRRASGDTLEVEVEVRSRGSLSWPNGAIQRRRLGPGETQTLSFDVLARSRGDIPLEVLVRDVSGSRVLANATLRVRSTFTSGPALAITATVVVLLLVVDRVRKGRRDGGEDDDPEGSDDGDPTPPGPGLSVLLSPDRPTTRPTTPAAPDGVPQPPRDPAPGGRP